MTDLAGEQELVRKESSSFPIYIGIDPGLDGAIVALCPTFVKSCVVPTLKQEKGSKRMYDVPEMVRLLKANVKDIVLVALEKGRAAPGQGVTSMFRFGYGCGLWEGILAGLGIPYVIVHPNTWQKVVCVGLSGEAKSRAMQATSSRLPKLNMRKSDRASTPHQGIADAACLALYSRHISIGNEAQSDA